MIYNLCGLALFQGYEKVVLLFHTALRYIKREILNCIKIKFLKILQGIVLEEQLFCIYKPFPVQINLVSS